MFKEIVVKEIIDTQIGVGQSNVVYTEVLIPSGRDATLQIRIVSDAYAFQSRAVVSRWDGTQWQQVHSIHHSQMKTPAGLCYVARTVQQDPATFKADRDQLVKVAAAILR